MQNTIGESMHRDETEAIITAVGTASQWQFGYLNALKVELQDVIEDVEMMMDLCRKRQKSGEITNYVRWQNTALFTREIKGLAALSSALDTIDPGRYETQDEMVRDINQIFEEKILKYDFPPVINALAQRKLDKVSRYTYG